MQNHHFLMLFCTWQHSTSIALSSATTSKSLAKWLSHAAGAIPEESKADEGNAENPNILALIDDVHVAMEHECSVHKGMGPVAELLRHVLCHKGLVR